jgi:hypothetical protein
MIAERIRHRFRACRPSSVASICRRVRAWRPSRVDVALTVVVGLASAFYEWTAQTSGLSPGEASQSYYYLLAQSFLHLHSYLPLTVPAGLEALTDPYGPAANAATLPFHDLVLYKDHFYSAWGPTPAITLYLPLRLLGVGVTDANAVPVFSLAALAFAVLLLRFVVRRFAPKTATWAVTLGACALAFGGAIPFLLRRPAIYEVAISAGACFMMAALYLLARGLLHGQTPRTRLLALASLCAGLAFGARPPQLLGSAVVAIAVVVVWRRSDLAPATRRRIAMALVAPLTACVLLVAAYNTERFGSPTQFGIDYQLAGIDTELKPTFDLAYVIPGVYNFALAPPRLALTFPHVFLPPPPNYPGTLPAGYNGTTQPAEPTGGVVPMAPIVLFAGTALFLWRRRDRHGAELPLIITALTLLGCGIIAGLAFTLWGTTERYEVDFDLYLILAGVLGWIGLLGAVRGRIRRRLSTIGGVAAIAWACFTGVAVSFTGYYNTLFTYHPGIFAALEDITGPLATLPTMLLGHPVIARVQSAVPIMYGNVNYATFGQGEASTYLGDGPVTLVVLAPGAQNLSVQAVVSTGPALPAGAPLGVVVSSPGRRPITVQLVPGIDLLPIHVHWGLNRIVFEMVGSQPGGPAIGLGDMILVKRLPPQAHRRAQRRLGASRTGRVG